MSNLLERAIEIGPGYLSDLLSLIQQPKRFVARRVSQRPLPMRDALTFLTISFALSWIIKMSFLRSAPWLEVLPDAVFVLLEVLVYGAVICVAWRAVRGRAELQKVFVIHFYYSGIFLMLIATWFLLVMGILRSADPAFYDAMWEAVYGGRMLSFALESADHLSQSPAAMPMALGLLLGLAATIAWVFAGWGAYRELNRLSRLRSAMAATIFVVLWFPISTMIFFVANAGVK
jgi:hypothetical protein